jgi:hypothetical protein
MPHSIIEIDWDIDAFGGAACGTPLKLHVSFRLTQFRHDGRFSSRGRYENTNRREESSVLTKP